jgi:hypothetical protein
MTRICPVSTLGVMNVIYDADASYDFYLKLTKKISSPSTPPLSLSRIFAVVTRIVLLFTSNLLFLYL